MDNDDLSSESLEQLKRNVQRMSAINPAPLGDLADGFERAAQAGLDGASAVEEALLAARWAGKA